nr:hypothetical protein [Tanacetum cinerariifolium]
MSTITNVKYVLSQKAFDAFCEKFHIPNEVHLVLPDRGNTMHERPAGNIGLYIRFFGFANFRLPFSTFLVNILRHFRINISQLSVIGAAKVSHFEILCRVYGIRSTVGFFRCFKVNSKKNGWMSYIKRSEKSHDEETYTLFLDKDGEDMDIFAFIHTSDPTKVKVVERRRKEDESRLLETTVGRTVPLLLVAPDHGESELDASVDKLFDEGGSGAQMEQGDFTGGGDEQGINIWPVTETTNIVAEDMIPGEPIPTRPFVTSFVSATPECELEGHTDFVTGLNLRTTSAPQRPSVPVITAATTITSTADPAVWNVTNGSRLDDGGVCHEMVDEFAPPKFFASVRGMKHDQLFTEFNVGAACQMSLSAEVRMRAEYNIRERMRLKYVVEEKDQLLKARDEEIKILKAQMLLKEAEATKSICLHAEASNFDIVEKSIRDEVSALNERNTILEKERNALDVKVTDLEAVVESKKRELTDSNAQLTSIKSQNDNLTDQVHELQVSFFGLKEKLSNYENLMERLKEFQDAQLKVVNDKFDKLYTDFVEMTLHLEERFYSQLLTTIARCIWLLTYGMELAIAKCLNSSEYLSALGTAISKAIEKGMQDGLAAGITHGKEGQVLTDVAAYNPSAEDASITALMNIIRLEEHLAERLGLNESQPHVDQLMVPIHHSSDKTVVGMKGTSDTAPDTTTTISTTFVSAISIPPISTDDYEVVRLDGQEGAGAESQAILIGMLIL